MTDHVHRRLHPLVVQRRADSKTLHRRDGRVARQRAIRRVGSLLARQGNRETLLRARLQPVTGDVSTSLRLRSGGERATLLRRRRRGAHDVRRRRGSPRPTSRRRRGDGDASPGKDERARGVLLLLGEERAERDANAVKRERAGAVLVAALRGDGDRVRLGDGDGGGGEFRSRGVIEGESDARVGVRRSVLIRSRRRARCRSGSRFRRRLRLRLLRQRLTRQRIGRRGYAAPTAGRRRRRWVFLRVRGGRS